MAGHRYASERLGSRLRGVFGTSARWIGAARHDLGRRDLGSIPIVVGLAIIWILFQSQNDRFLSPANLTNLIIQIAPVVVIGLGLVLVLIAGEIDLSVGIVSGLCGAILAVVNVRLGFDPLLATAAALLVGALIGAFYGTVVVRLGVPSFIVTLAGLVGWQGALLFVLGRDGAINLQPSLVTDLTWTYLPSLVSWLIAAAIVSVYVALHIGERRRRRAAGLPRKSSMGAAMRAGILAVTLATVIILLDQDRGVPTALVVIGVLALVVESFLKRTRYGRHILAVGGNREAARRSGIPVNRVRLLVMTLASTFAAAGGILFASRLMSVSYSSGSGEVLLNAVAAVVIGGTSLFGGRGTAYSALLGMLVIGSISNGMDLLLLPSSVKLMITGGVLLLAVALDSIARRPAS